MSFKHDIPAVIKHISCYNTYYIKYFPGESMANSDIDSKIKELQKIIDDSDNIVFFGGAGVSTESGIPDFRSTDGLYNQEWDYPPEEIISRSFFYKDTKEFYRFYRAKLLPQGIKPNAAHYKLAELEAAGYAIIGVSKDRQELQKKFADAHGLQFPLIADTETTLLQELGCWGEKVTCGRKTIGILRTTYLVDENGIIEKIFTPKEIKTKIHAEQILNAIKG